MSPWIAFLVTLSVIILVHEWGHFLIARAIGVRVERFSLGFGPRLLKFRRGDTEYALSLFPFGGYVKMAGEAMEADAGPKKLWEYRARSPLERASIVLAGPFINYLLGFGLFLFIFVVGAPMVSSRIGQVLEGYPAAAAGLKSGDRIVAVNSKPVSTWEEVTQAIHSETTWLTVAAEREGISLSVRLEPRVDEVTNLIGVRLRVGMIGITPSDEVLTRRYPPGEAAVKAAQRIWGLTTLTLQALGRIMGGGLSIKESITGPIGIFHITSSVAEQGWVSLLQLIAILSTSLGLFNLLPIPVLDGGHLAFLLMEQFRGRPVSFRAQEMMTRVGLGLLCLLLVVVTYNDLVKFKLTPRFLPFLGSGQEIIQEPMEGSLGE